MDDLKSEAEQYAAARKKAQAERRVDPMQPLWTAVDDYFGGLLAAGDPALDAALAANRRAGLPPIDVPRMLGKFLELLVRITGAREILEIGTLGGYSTIWMARGLPTGGRIVTLEFNPHHAAVARENLRNAGVLDCVDFREGRAVDSLATLEAEGAGPFDLIFVDADKPSNAEYFAFALRFSRPGTVIVYDNVVRDGKVVDADGGDADVQGVRRLMDVMAAERRVSATVLQTVGSKGYDGFAIAVVLR